MSLSILIRGTGDPYTSLTAAKAADNIKKALDPTTAGQWTVAGSKEELTAALADLKTNQSSISAIIIGSSGKLELNGSQVRSYKDVILKLSDGKLDVKDDAVGLGGNNYSSLDAVYSKINSITVNNSLNVSVAYSDYQAALTNNHEQGLEEKIKANSTGNASGVAITNFSGSKSNLDAVLLDNDVKTVTIKDSIANLATNTSSILVGDNISKITGVIAADTLANVKADAIKAENARTLKGDLLTKVSSVSIAMSASDVTTANIAAINALPEAIKSKLNIAISGTAAAIGTNAANITALGSKVSSIEATGGASIADLTKISGLKTKFTAISIVDTGANLAKTTVLADAVTAWSSKISEIKISALPSSADLTKILTAAGQSISVSISDTSAKINTDLALTNSVIRSNSDSLSSVAVTDGTTQKKAILKMANEQYSLLKDKFTGQNTFDLSGVAYADLNTADSDSNVVSYGVKDTYSNITNSNANPSNLSGLFNKTKLSSLDVTGATVANVTTITTAFNSLTAANKSKFKSVAVTDIASSLLSTTKLTELGANALVKSINANDATIANITALKAAAKVSSIKVLDSDANYSLASNAALIADAKVTSFALTEVAAAKLVGNSIYINNPKITSIGVSDTAAHIAATGVTIMNGTKISTITANAALISDISALSATTGDNAYTKPVSINVSDNWTNIKNYFSGAGAIANSKVKSFSVTSWS